MTTVPIIRRSFSVDDYARMREAGILSEDDLVELIDGEVRAMTPIGPLHAAIVKRFNALLAPQLAGRAILSVQDPIRLNDYSEPQPDLAILRPRDDFYATKHPNAADVLLVIEVADQSLEYDRQEKIPRYADAGIAEAWLVDAASRTIEQHTQPRDGRYRNKRVAASHDVLTAEMIADVAVAVAEVFGP